MTKSKSFTLMGIGIMGVWLFLGYIVPREYINFLLYIAGCFMGISIGMGIQRRAIQSNHSTTTDNGLGG